MRKEKQTWLKDFARERPYFDFTKSELKPSKFVAWIDIMGSSSYMAISENKSAIFIGKLHSCILRSRRYSDFNGGVYPFVDGCYATSENLPNLLKFLKCFFFIMAINFILEDRDENRFMCRGSISFGNVIEPDAIMNCNAEFQDKQNDDYTLGILFGSSLARVNAAEKLAAPFGVWVDEMARMIPPIPKLPMTNWRWWNHKSGIDGIDRYDRDIETELAECLKSYLAWCRKNSHEMLYAEEAITRHEHIASQYFTSWA